MTSPTRNAILKHPLLALALTFIVISVSLVLFAQYRYAFHSDDAVKTVLSRLAFFDASLVPRNWVYANGDVLLLSPYIFSIIVYPLLGVSYQANATASWLAFLCLILATYFGTKKFADGSSRAPLIAAIISASGISAANFEFVIAQGAYSMYAAAAILIYAAACPPRTAQCDNRGTAPPWISSLYLFIPAMLASVSNPTRGIVTIILPVVSGWTAFLLFSVQQSDWKALFISHFKSIFLIFLGSLTGYLLYKYAIYPRILNFDAAAKLKIAPRQEIIDHIQKIPSAWFEYFQLWGKWESLPTPLKALQIPAWLIASALITLPIFTVINPRKHSQSIVCLAWILLASYAVIFFSMIVSPTLFSDSLSIRYATLPMYGAVCMLAIYLDKLVSRHALYGKATLAGVMALSIFSAQLWRQEYKPNYVSLGGASYSQRESLIKLLEANNVGTILTTYWNSHVITVLSDDAVDAYPVSIGSQLTPFAELMPRHIFYGSAGKRQAVVLNGADSNVNAWTAVEYQLGRPYERISVGPFIIWIYNRNVSEAVLQTDSGIDSAISPKLLELALSETNIAACHSHNDCRHQINAVNIGRHVLSSVGFHPMRLGLVGLDSNGSIVIQDAGRANFPVALEPGDSTRIELTVPVSADARVTNYRLCLLQEGVNWLCDHTQTQPGHN